MNFNEKFYCQKIGCKFGDYFPIFLWFVAKLEHHLKRMLLLKTLSVTDKNCNGSRNSVNGDNCIIIFHKETLNYHPYSLSPSPLS